MSPEELARRERRAAESTRAAIITVAVNMALVACIARQLGMW